eukprot:NODE_616_length_5370_cov_0.348131.p3 type:complete len:270 gc:universal NODE_616_length_5370_cov_0.348131:2232-1423(-)
MLLYTLFYAVLFQIMSNEANQFIIKHATLIENCEITFLQFIQNDNLQVDLCIIPHLILIKAKSIINNMLSNIKQQHLFYDFIHLLLGDVTKLQKRHLENRFSSKLIHKFGKVALILILAGGESGLMYYIRKSFKETTNRSIQMNQIHNQKYDLQDEQKKHCLFFETCLEKDCVVDNSCVDTATGVCSTLPIMKQAICYDHLNDCSVIPYLDWNSDQCVAFQKNHIEKLETMYHELNVKNQKQSQYAIPAVIASIITGAVLICTICNVIQ